VFSKQISPQFTFSFLLQNKMSAEEDTELRDLVAQCLETNGVLNKIRAELRANVFMALEEQDSLKNSKVGNQKLKAFLSTKEGAIVGSLVREFLSCFNLDFTIAVFDPECCHDEQFTRRDELVNALNLTPSSKDSPLLLELLHSFQGEKTGVKLQLKSKNGSDNSPPFSPRTGSKIPQRIEQKSKGDSTLSSEDRSVDSSKERSQSNKIDFNGKLKSRSDFEDEDSELLAELGLLRESNKKPRGGGLNNNEMKKKVNDGGGLGSLKDAPPLPGLGKKSDYSPTDMNSSGDWQDLAAIEAKINKLGFDIPKDDNYGYEDDFVNSSSRKSEGLSITEEIEEDISIGSFAGSKGDDLFTTDQTVSQMSATSFDYAEDVDV